MINARVIHNPKSWEYQLGDLLVAAHSPGDAVPPGWTVQSNFRYRTCQAGDTMPADVLVRFIGPMPELTDHGSAVRR